MFRIFTLAMLSSTLWIGCSPVADEGRNDSASPSKQVASGKLPFQVTWIESGEEREKRDIQQKAKALFASRDFDALDALAGSHRESKACYANGVWKLNEVHVGLQLPREASDAAWKTHLATLRNWTESKPESITARTKLAAELVSYAWRARGGGYAKTVSQEGWTVFRANLNEARSVLTAARSLKAKCPRWWSSMMQVALGTGMERQDYETLFNEAIRNYPQYAIYYSCKSTYLLPRWHGKPGEWERFLSKAADEIGGEDGDVLYARVAWHMHENVFANPFEESAMSWSRVERGFKVLESRFPTSVALRNERAYLAVFGCGRPAAQKYFEQLDGKVDLVVWKSKENFSQKASWVYAR